MLGESLVMPVLTLVVALISLFTSPAKLKNRWLLSTLLSALFLTCGFQIYFNYATERENARLRGWVEDLTKTVASFRSEANSQLATIAAVLRTYGWSVQKLADFRLAEQSFQAAQARATLALRRVTEAPSRVTVQYFPKDVDRAIVEQALRELGFYLRTGVTQVPDVPTNAMWYGSDVRPEQVQLVAYTLMQAGVTIKVIQPFENSAGRERLIQVGADRGYETAVPLSVDGVRRTLSFPQLERGKDEGKKGISPK